MDVYIISSLVDKSLEKGWLDPCVTFQETAKLVSKVVVPVAFPPAVCAWFQFIYILVNPWYGQSF